MIKYEEAEIISVLPPFIKENVDVQAISYAVRKGMERLISFSKSTALYANIDFLGEELLDLLALELRTQYYDEGVSLSTKRQLIKNTLIWYEKAGTPAAVGELVATVFGEGKVEEWFEYGGAPYRFRIITNATLTPEMNALFNQMVKQIKNARSHLESISIIRAIRQPVYAGTGQASYSRPAAIMEGYQKEWQQEQLTLTGVARTECYKPEAIREGFFMDKQVNTSWIAGTGTITSHTKTEAIKQIGGETYATTI